MFPTFKKCQVFWTRLQALLALSLGPFPTLSPSYTGNHCNQVGAHSVDLLVCISSHNIYVPRAHCMQILSAIPVMKRLTPISPGRKTAHKPNNSKGITGSAWASGGGGSHSLSTFHIPSVSLPVINPPCWSQWQELSSPSLNLLSICSLEDQERNLFIYIGPVLPKKQPQTYREDDQQQNNQSHHALLPRDNE